MLRSWSLLQRADEINSSLSLRLSARLARTLANGVCVGSLSLDDISKEAERVERLRSCADAGSESSLVEVQGLWKDWDSVRAHASILGEKAKEQAEIDVARMPLLKRYL